MTSAQLDSTELPLLLTGGGEGHGHSSGRRNAVVTKAATAACKAA